MNSKLFFLILTISLSMLIACGSQKQLVKSDTQTVSGSSVPIFYETPPQSPDTLFAAATATSKDLQMAVNKAKQQGRADIGSQLEIRLQGLNKQFQEEVGVGEESDFAAQATVVIKEVISQTLNGCKVKHQKTNKEGSIWRAYVLMQYPIGAANAQFLESLKNKKILNQRVRATDAFKELDAEVQKYEQEKNK